MSMLDWHRHPVGAAGGGGTRQAAQLAKILIHLVAIHANDSLGLKLAHHMWVVIRLDHRQPADASVREMPERDIERFALGNARPPGFAVMTVRISVSVRSSSGTRPMSVIDTTPTNPKAVNHGCAFDPRRAEARLD